MKNIKEESNSLSKRAYDEIKKDIESGLLRPGTRLTELGLTKKLGVSRTPVREALKRLEYDGYLVNINGYEVKSLSAKEIGDILEIRSALESEAARLATSRISEADTRKLEENLSQEEEILNMPPQEDRLEKFLYCDQEFHRIILDATENPLFRKTESVLQDKLYRLRLAMVTDDEMMKLCVSQHRNILNAISSGDAEAAKFFSRAHLVTIRDVFERIISGDQARA